MMHREDKMVATLINLLSTEGVKLLILGVQNSLVGNEVA